jgi:hypothetical protein
MKQAYVYILKRSALEDNRHIHGFDILRYKVYLVKGLMELFLASRRPSNGRPNRSNLRRVSDTLIETILA